MRNRILAVLFLVFIAGGVSVVSAQRTTRIKKADELTPAWTYKGRWYGLVTCNRLQRNGHKVTPDQVKKCIADGGTYILATPGRLDVGPPEKLAPFAGQQVYLTGILTSRQYGSGPTSDEAIEGLYAGADRPATKFNVVQVSSVTPTAYDDAMAKYSAIDADFGARVSEK